MISRSFGWFICISVAVVSASDYRKPISITGSDPGITLNHVGTYNPEWSVMESDRKFEEMSGGTRVVVETVAMAAGSPAFTSTLQRHEMRTTDGQGAVPDAEDPVLRQMMDLLRAVSGPQLPYASPQLASAASESTPEAECGQLVPEPLSVESAVAAAVGAIKHSCDSLRPAAVDFISDHLGQVLDSQGWAHAVRTQPEEVVQLSRLMSQRLAATSAPTTTQPSATLTTQQDSDDTEDNGHSQTLAATETPMATCPTTPLDDDKISFLRSLSDREKESRLIKAANEGEVEELRTLLAAGAFAGAKDRHGKTALHRSASNGFVKVVRCLLDAGADVDPKDNDGNQPLHKAASCGDPAVVQLLAAWGANPNARNFCGSTPLHLAVGDRHPEAALALLDAGADRNVRNDIGRTPLDEARKRDSQLLIDILTESAPATTQPSATPTTQQDSDDTEDSRQSQTLAATETPMATCPTTPLDDDTISFLRSLSDREKESRLIKAAKEGEVEELRTLLAAGAFTGAKDRYGKTALHRSASNGFVKVVRCLLDAGADVDPKDNEEYQPLHFAAMGGDPGVVQLLAVWGANPNARDIYGWTPLHLAVRDRHPDAALALLKAGADRNVRNNIGRTPLDEARKRDYQLLIDILTKS